VQEYLEIVELALPGFGLTAKLAQDIGRSGEIPND
jgi:hypothetical protein